MGRGERRGAGPVVGRDGTGPVGVRTPQNALLEELFKKLPDMWPIVPLSPGCSGPGNEVRLLGQPFAKREKLRLIERDFFLAIVEVQFGYP
jgi:hypothetical protein